MQSLKVSAYICAALLCSLFIGCLHDEGGSGSSSSSGNLDEVICKVEGRSNSGVSLQPGDIGFYDCGAYRIIVTENTTILRDRESCSGLAEAGFGEIINGDTLFVSFKTENVNYASSPTEIRATRIEGYPKNCVNGTTLLGEQSDDCSTCPDPFFD